LGCYSYPAYASYLCYGGWPGYGMGGYSYYGLCYGGYSTAFAPAYISPSGPQSPSRPAEKIPAPTNGKGESQTASITFNLPTGARLFVDGKLIDTRAPSLTFKTPELASGQTYAYTFRAEVAQGATSRSDTQRVLFRPGETLTVSFPGLTGTTTQTAQAGGR
jgi:uncharacterized protein (TIGR03000 family)